MNINDMILCSVDDHIVEPPDMFKGRLPARFQDDAPRVVRMRDGSDAWRFSGRFIPQVGSGAVAGRPREEHGADPTSYDEMRTGCYDVHARVHDMNVNGQLASLNFSSFPGFAARQFLPAGPELGLAVVQAYNDWHIEDWCGAYPGRFIPLAIPPMWDASMLAMEVHRVAEKGCHAMAFSENPTKSGLPGFNTDHWDPFWRACCDEGTVVCIHIGSSGELLVTSPDSPLDVTCSLQPVNSILVAAELLWSPVLRKFPQLRVSLSEGGIGWIPYILERLDRWQEMQHPWTGQDFGGRRPSDVFREQVVTCFVADPHGLRSRHEIGVDMITWECDYPHSDSTWPYSPETVHAELAQAGVPDDECNKITYQNAVRLFDFDPFSHRKPEECTVGALRALSPDVDVHTASIGRKHHIGGSAADLAKRMAGAASVE
jgi:predicted TIM-barrel fold metal-dependent hydrolase